MSLSAELPVIGDLRAHAIEYARQGFEIFPVHGPTKQPMAAHVPGAPSQYRATTDVDTVAAWWDRWPNALIGHRLPDEHIILDIDPRHGGHDTWRAFKEAHGIGYPQTRLHVSGRNDGGGHMWFLRPADKLTISKFDDWAREHGTGHAVHDSEGNDRGWVCGLDLLHRNHRYTILPPSPHPETGQPYRWHQWADVAEAHPAVAAILTNDSPPPPPYVPKTYDGDSIAEWFTARFGVSEWLHKHGWHLRSTGSGDADGAKWQHPTATAPVSATVRHGCLFVYSPNTPFDVTAPGDPHGYTSFRVYAILEHGGDLSAAARAAREMKDGPSTKVKQADPFGRDLPPLGTAPPAADPETGELRSDGPVPLDRFDLPKFPLDVLPKWMRTEVVATAEAIQAPVEIAAGLALVALSTACAGKVDVDGINYRQPTNLYLSIVAASGIGKSPVASRMLAPLYDLEEQLAEEARNEIAEAMAEATAIEEQITAAKSELKKDAASQRARDAMRDAELARLGHEIPATPRLIADDHTPEALGHLIAGQKGTRMAVLSPEGATLFSTMTGQRYKSGDTPPEVPPVYLKSWGGEPMPIDRKGSTSITVKRPILTVGVLVQPFVVDRLAMTPQIAAQGALARFLWIVAEDNVGRRDRSRRRHVAPLSPEYVTRVTDLARRCASWQMPACLTATEEAADHLDAVNEAREARMGLGGDLDAYREIEAKMVGYQWRLAALLAMAHGDDLGGGLTLERAKQAEVLADYFLAHSIAVHRRAGLDERGGTLRACAAYVARHAGEEIDWRDFQLAMRTVYGQMSDAQADLAELERMRWVVIVDGELSAVGVKGAKNPTVKVDARTRAFSAGKDGA